jgi:AsmA protein
MKLKTIGLVLGGLVGVLVLAIALFFVFFPKQLAAREAEQRIEAATHRRLTLGDDINVTFFPALGFSVNAVSLSNPEGFDQAQPFLTADRVVFAVAVVPLLHGDIQVRELTFQRAHINLHAKQNGESNWTFPTENNSHDQTTLEDLRLDDVRLIDSAISFQGADAQPPLELGHVDSQLALESLDQPAHLTAAFDYRDQRLNIDGTITKPRAVIEHGETPLNVALRSPPLSANFNGAFNAQSGALQGQLSANGTSLRRMLSWLGTPMDQGAGFGAFNVSAAMTHHDQDTALTHLSLRLDAIQATGNLTLTQPPLGRLNITGALAAPLIDLNTYMPPPAQGAQAGGVSTDSAWSTAPLDFTGLRALDANLDLALGGLKFQRMTFTNVALNLRVARGAADARLTRIALYGGTGTARLIADGSGATPRIAAELNTQNIQAEPLLRDAVGFDKISGRGRLVAALAGQGASQAAVMHSLRGTASFAFNDGQIKGVNLAAVARTIQSALSGQAAGPGAATDFAELSSTFQIASGVAATQDLRMLNPYVRIDGQGLIDIGNQSLDMRLAPRVVNSAQGQGGNASLAGLGIPFRIHGPWSHVGFEPALGDLLQNQLRAQAVGILGHQQTGSPLAQLGASLFGEQPAQSGTPAATTAPAPPGQTPAQQPAQQQQQTPRNPLEDLLRQATRPRGSNNSNTTTTTATPSP